MASPYSNDDLAALRKALISGTQSVSVAGKTITFRSLSELQSLIAQVEASLNADKPVEQQAPKRKTVWPMTFFSRRIPRW